MNISKLELQKAIQFMEIELTGKHGGDLDGMVGKILLRIYAVLSRAYIENYYPEQSLILKESLRMLEQKGYYYTIE